MSDTLNIKGEAQRVRTTGKITRFLMDNPKADFDKTAKATGLSVTTIKRYWDDACYAVKLNKSRIRPDMTNPPRSIQVEGMEVYYNPQDYDNEFLGGTFRTADLPDVYLYARQDDGRLESTYEINGYEINWGCCGSVTPDKFDRWIRLCTFVSAQARNLESKLAAKRRLGASGESQKPEEA